MQDEELLQPGVQGRRRQGPQGVLQGGKPGGGEEGQGWGEGEDQGGRCTGEGFCKHYGVKIGDGKWGYKF